jgi:serine/threonine protein phosphatase PrpC
MAQLMACATQTNKTGTNQDSCTVFSNQSAGISGIIVADGIGSHFKAEAAAAFCSLKLKEILEHVKTVDELNFETYYCHVKLALLDFAKTTDDFDFNTIDKDKSLGTTLLCILDDGTKYHIAYAGNGSIWQVDGRFNKFSNSFYLPWNSINLLNPHSIEQEGKPALYRYLSVSDTQYRPTVFTLNKNDFIPGELLIVTSDGIFSNDAVPVGKDANGTLWIKAEEAMPLLYSHLSSFLMANPREAKNEDLEFTLNQFLAILKDKQLMHDDTTIGVLISEKAIEFHQAIYEKNSAEQFLNEENNNK